MCEKLFDKIAFASPCILMFDEIDSSQGPEAEVLAVSEPEIALSIRF
jgi:hypothetical protein